MSTPLSMIDLTEAFSKDGCPVCRMAKKDAEVYLHSLLFEGYRFPENHDKFRAGRGLCNSHAWFMEKQYRGALLNIATYYRGALNDVLKILEKGAPDSGGQPGGGFLGRLTGGGAAPSSPLANKLEPTGPCVACEIRASSEKRNCRTVGEFITNERLNKVYRGSQGLCLPHFREALRAAPDAPRQKELVAIQRDIWLALLAELDEFREMHDHRHTGEWMGEEGDSWLRVLQAMAGGEGMFGVDASVD